MAKQDDYTRYTIRLPTPLYERVKEAAGEASVNSLVVQVLEEKYPAPKPIDVLSYIYRVFSRLTSRTTDSEKESWAAEITTELQRNRVPLRVSPIEGGGVMVELVPDLLEPDGSNRPDILGKDGDYLLVGPVLTYTKGREPYPPGDDDLPHPP